MTSNNYAAGELVELGIAQEFIRGCTKGIFVDDGPDQELRTIINDDIE